MYMKSFLNALIGLAIVFLVLYFLVNEGEKRERKKRAREDEVRFQHDFYDLLLTYNAETFRFRRFVENFNGSINEAYDAYFTDEKVKSLIENVKDDRSFLDASEELMKRNGYRRVK